MVGKPCQIESEDQRLRPQGSEVERLLADNTLAKSLLQWKPQVTLEDGLNRTVAWIQDNLEFYRESAYVY